MPARTFRPPGSPLSLSLHQLYELRSALHHHSPPALRPSQHTMDAWPLDDHCAFEYSDSANRRFHAQPVACPACGPHYFYQAGGQIERGDTAGIRMAVQDLRSGKIVAVKGLGGYHLSCDARK